MSLTGLIGLVVFVTAVNSADKCYLCSTSYLAKCGNSILDDSDIQTCQRTSPLSMKCVTYSYMLEGREIIYRGCKTQVSSCEELAETLQKENLAMKGCSICDSDFCNTGPPNSNEPIKITFVLLLLALACNTILINY